MMTDQELQEEAGILDKACRQVGHELTSHGLAALSGAAVATVAMQTKLKKLEALKAALMASEATPQAQD